MWKRWMALGLSAACLLSAPAADAAAIAYLRIKGQKQGDFRGGATQKGREGMLEVDATTHEIVSPHDVSTGLASGKRQHKPLAVVVELDRALPQLYAALVNNETLTSVELKFYRPSSSGAEQQFFTIKLTNASIASIRFVQPNVKVADQARLPETAEVSFAYQRIEWLWTDGGVSAQDDVRSR